MSNETLMDALRESYRDVMSRSSQTEKVVSVRRYFVVIADLLDLWLKFQRDRKYGWYGW
jgi:hypothetical protein